MKKKSQNRTNAESFEQLLIEIKKLHTEVKDIYYSTHIGNWTVEYTDGEIEEVPEAAEFLHEVIYRYRQQFKGQQP